MKLDAIDDSIGNATGMTQEMVELMKALMVGRAKFEPVEAANRVVSLSLLRKQQRYPVFVGESRPA